MKENFQTALRYGVHLGHSKSKKNSKMTHYLLENPTYEKNRLAISETLAQLRIVKSLVEDIERKKGYVLVVSSGQTKAHNSLLAFFCQQRSPFLKFANSTSTSLPSLIFFPDCLLHQRGRIREANRLAIPTIGIVDSNSNPINLSYAIPGNDDSLESLYFYLANLFGKKK